MINKSTIVPCPDARLKYVSVVAFCVYVTLFLTTLKWHVTILRGHKSVWRPMYTSAIPLFIVIFYSCHVTEHVLSGL